MNELSVCLKFLDIILNLVLRSGYLFFFLVLYTNFILLYYLKKLRIFSQNHPVVLYWNKDVMTIITLKLIKQKKLNTIICIMEEHQAKILLITKIQKIHFRLLIHFPSVWSIHYHRANDFRNSWKFHRAQLSFLESNFYL